LFVDEHKVNNTGKTNYVDEKDLVEFLLKKYDTRVRPVLNSSTVVKVTLGMTPIYLSDVVSRDSS